MGSKSICRWPKAVKTWIFFWFYVKKKKFENFLSFISMKFEFVIILNSTFFALNKREYILFYFSFALIFAWHRLDHIHQKICKTCRKQSLYRLLSKEHWRRYALSTYSFKLKTKKMNTLKSNSKTFQIKQENKYKKILQDWWTHKMNLLKWIWSIQPRK